VARIHFVIRGAKITLHFICAKAPAAVNINKSPRAEKKKKDGILY
jgi:hypothetical protein